MATIDTAERVSTDTSVGGHTIGATRYDVEAGRGLNLLVLHCVHYHPVEGVDVLPNEVLKHDECLHQKILQRDSMAVRQPTQEEGEHSSQ